MKYLLYVLLLIELCGCDTIVKKLELINNTNETKYCLMKSDTTLGHDYPNLSLNLIEVTPNDSVWPSLVSGNSDQIWEYMINNHSLDSTLFLYFFDTNMIDKTIIDGKKYKRLDLKVKDLEKLHWIVNIK